ncbi:MAG: aminotransferase class I and II [Gemmatimonadetes bacterium]|nr:aminotransferase class I and II [Gemmatimonadota bacterium]
MTVPVVTATRYVTPLKEGGSLPAVVESEGPNTWVVKFRGAGQGPRALVAELIVGLLARALDLPVPDLALVDVDPAFGRTEKDPEIQDILSGSHGLNVGLRFLEGSFNLDPTAASDVITQEFASAVVWLDALVFNPDRTHRNPNILVWERSPYLIDHGAALYFHHDWERMTAARAKEPFRQVGQHVLLDRADRIEELDPNLAARLPADVIRRVVAQVPDTLLEEGGGGSGTIGGRRSDGAVRVPASTTSPAALRDRYVQFLEARLAGSRDWVRAAAEERKQVLATTPKRVQARR